MTAPSPEWLSATWRPRPFQQRWRLDPDLLDAVWSELAGWAAMDAEQCCGYFPSLAGRAGIVHDLPACRRFADECPEIVTEGCTLRFSFIRVSLRRQAEAPAYHLDTDASTAVTGKPATLKDRLVRRVLLNLSATQERVLHYLDLDPYTTRLAYRASYVCLGDTEAARDRETHITIPPRRGCIIHGVSFVANHVLHSGVDTESGHFVAAYGLETPDESRFSGLPI